eukprot:CAMPEP_0113887338 /NCGR_PEP_ID=MMETSP0780_2-20120614/12153_1 /TAXON_ID=652834 /ORGANISM="Palpitomonas bilix" /LENGTH=495 /DNA_ID=CAMNT_0000875849 /DNA_START=1307 /DNA_END=2794 /DNA_ORIENTATION=+ /assembly_acc=CAM_ASM_000599
MAVGGVALAAGAAYLALNETHGKPAGDKAKDASREFRKLVVTLKQNLTEERKNSPGADYVTKVVTLVTPMASFFVAMEKKMGNMVEVWNKEIAQPLNMDAYVPGKEKNLQKVKGMKATVEVYERAKLLEFALTQCARKIVVLYSELAKSAAQVKTVDAIDQTYRETQAIRDIFQLLNGMQIGGKKYVGLQAPTGFNEALGNVMTTLTQAEGKAVELNTVKTWNVELASAIKQRRKPNLMGKNLSPEMRAIKEALEQYANWAVSLAQKRPFDMPGETKYTLAKEAQTAVDQWLGNYKKMRQKVEVLDAEGPGAVTWHLMKPRVISFVTNTGASLVAAYMGISPAQVVGALGLLSSAWGAAKAAYHAEWKNPVARKTKALMGWIAKKAKFWTSEDIGSPEQVSDMIQAGDDKAVEFLRGAGVAKYMILILAGEKELSDEEMYHLSVDLYVTVHKAPTGKKLNTCHQWLLGNRHQISSYSPGQFDLSGLDQDWVDLFP